MPILHMNFQPSEKDLKMRFEVRNLGPLREAAIELGSLTVVCGKNNCGKTYLAYTLDTFLDTIEYNVRLPLRDVDLTALFSKGAIVVDLRNYVDDYLDIVQKTIPDFTGTLPRFLAMDIGRFARTEVVVPLTKEEIITSLESQQEPRGNNVEGGLQITKSSSIVIRRSSASTKVVISLINTSAELPSRKIVNAAIGFKLAHLFNSSLSIPLFPKSFIITSERTGAALFRSELMSIKVRKDQEQNKPQYPTGYKGYGYQRPVEKDIEFILELKRFLPRKSYIAEMHPEILDFFSTIAGGSYELDESIDQVLFKPCSVGGSLSLAESSSTVRALAELYFYLRHRARKGQLLMFDEPEINLHPENQRKLARLFAMLVKVGIKVFITTHSDYIVREINALIRIGTLDVAARRYVSDKHGYHDGEELSPNEVKFFVLKDGFTDEVKFDVESCSFGISSFDDTIEKFNLLYNDLMDLKHE